MNLSTKREVIAILAKGIAKTKARTSLITQNRDNHKPRLVDIRESDLNEAILGREIA